MCTVIFIPTKTGAILSSNRDDDPARPMALMPALINASTGRMIYPIDSFALGTWVGVHELGHVIILLNGADKSHVHKGTYTKSRGLIVKELLNSFNPGKDWATIDLRHTAPFTLVIWERGLLREMIWDGEKKNATCKSACEPCIWSSSTLYNIKEKAERHRWFHHWCSNTTIPTVRNLYHMLMKHNDDHHGFVMNRDDLIKTLSISLLEVDATRISFRHFDLAKNMMVSVAMPSKPTYATVSALAENL